MQTSVYERVRGLLGRLLDDNDMRHWYIHADNIVIHPNYSHASKNNNSSYTNNFINYNLIILALLAAQPQSHAVQQ